MFKILWQLPQSVHGVVPFYTQILLAIVFKPHARSYFWPGRAQKNAYVFASLSLPLRLLLDLVHREIISQIAPLTDHSNLHQPFIFLVPKNAKLHEIHTSIFGSRIGYHFSGNWSIGWRFSFRLGKPGIATQNQIDKIKFTQLSPKATLGWGEGE